MSPHPTLADVAKVAGVSAVTVSRFVVRPGLVAAATAARIREAIETVGYIPDRAAGRLAGSRSRVVAAVVPGLDVGLFGGTLRGLSDGCAAEGLTLMLGQSDYDPATEEALVESFIGWRPEGIVLLGDVHTDRTRRRLRAAGVTVVEAWDLPADPIGFAIGSSSERAAAALTQALLSLDYRRIGFGARLATIGRVAQRIAGYTRAMHAGGLAPQVLRCDPSLPPLQAGAALARLFLEATPRPEAIMLASDLLAVGALHECQRLGVAVPEHIALAGFGDLDIANSTVPTLTTVAFPSHEIGLRAIRTVIDPTRAEPLADLGFTVLQRGSTVRAG